MKAIAAGFLLLSNPWCYPARTNTTSNVDGFKVVFPGAVNDRIEVLDETTRLQSGRDLPMRWYRLAEERTLWLVTATDVTSISLDKEAAMANAKNGLLKETQGALVREERVSVGGHPCVDLRIQTPAGSIMRVRACPTTTRVYRLTVLTAEEEARREDVDRFFDSFAITQ